MHGMDGTDRSVVGHAADDLPRPGAGRTETATFDVGPHRHDGIAAGPAHEHPEASPRGGADPEHGGPMAVMYARSTTIHGDPGAVREGIAYVHDEVMPVLRAMDGCVGLSMLADRDSGRCIVTTSWRDE